MKCPHCAQEINALATSCSICGGEIETRRAPDYEATRPNSLGLETAGIALLGLGAAIFLIAANAGAVGPAWAAIVLFVIGLVTFLGGRDRVAVR